LKGRKFALWGLAFKPRTDDVREAPALHMAKVLVERGAKVSAFDPEAIRTTKRDLGDLIDYATGRYEACDGADALIVATEWNEFRSPDFDELGRRLKRKLIFDGRNIYDLEVMKSEKYTY
jgi:UDPglucose 6-dehydrogenase